MCGTFLPTVAKCGEVSDSAEGTEQTTNCYSEIGIPIFIDLSLVLAAFERSRLGQREETEKNNVDCAAKYDKRKIKRLESKKNKGMRGKY